MLKIWEKVALHSGRNGLIQTKTTVCKFFLGPGPLFIGYEGFNYSTGSFWNHPVQ